MSQHGRATIDSRNPRALGVCERCGALYNHHQLRWQSDWRGPRIQNLQILVCEGCYDALQPSGQRTIRLSADPLPIRDASVEDYVLNSQPLAGIGGNPDPSRWRYGSVIGSMTEGGGPQAAFDGNPAKPSFMAAVTSRSNSSFANYVGVNWQGPYQAITPSSLGVPVLTHSLSSFTFNAPTDSTFGSTAYLVQGAAFDSPISTVWTTLASGDLAGTIGERVSGEPQVGSGRYQFHRVAFFGSSDVAIAVAQVTFTVSDGSSNAQGV